MNTIQFFLVYLKVFKQNQNPKWRYQTTTKADDRIKARDQDMPGKANSLVNTSPKLSQVNLSATHEVDCGQFLTFSLNQV